MTLRSLHGFVPLLLLLSLLAAGCGGRQNSLPAVPLQGKVVLSGGAPAKLLSDRQSAVQLESLDFPGVTAFGDILEDGSFTVTTVKDGVVIPGAVEGNHRVRLIIDEQLLNVVPPRYERFDTSGVVVRVAKDEEVVVAIAR